MLHKRKMPTLFRVSHHRALTGLCILQPRVAPTVGHVWGAEQLDVSFNQDCKGGKDGGGLIEDP